MTRRILDIRRARSPAPDPDPAGATPSAPAGPDHPKPEAVRHMADAAASPADPGPAIQAPVPGTPEIPEERSGTAREAPGTFEERDPSLGSDLRSAQGQALPVAGAGVDVGAQPAAPSPKAAGAGSAPAAALLPVRDGPRLTAVAAVLGAAWGDWRLEHVFHAGQDTGRGRIVHCPPGAPDTVAMVASWAVAHGAWCALVRRRRPVPADIVAAVLAFYTPAEAVAWLVAPHPQLGGASALVMIVAGGGDRVRAVLRRLDADGYL